MNELQPCPFCGSKELDIKQIQHNRNEAVYCVRCLGECECEGPVEFTRENAERGWNMRAERRWISVEERLPERHADVLIVRDCDMYEVACVDIDGDWESRGPIRGVTHWMPLPPLTGEKVQRALQAKFSEGSELANHNPGLGMNATFIIQRETALGAPEKEVQG